MARSDADPKLELIGLTIEQTASVLGVDRERVANLIRAGVLPHIKWGGRYVVGRQALQEWVTRECWRNAQVPLEGQPSTERTNGHVPALHRRATAARGVGL